MADRHQFRASWHNYNGGVYFVTICSHEKAQIFGMIKEGVFTPSPVGTIVATCITQISNIHPHAEIHNFVVMPNHVHLMLMIRGQDGMVVPQGAEGNGGLVNVGCLKGPMHGEPVDDDHFNSGVAVVIRTFKAAVTRMVRRAELGDGSGASATLAQCIAGRRPIWQRNYHEHIIRDQRAYENIMKYIDHNVENWEKDCFATL